MTQSSSTFNIIFLSLKWSKQEFYKLGVIIVDNKDEGSFPEKTGEWKSVLRDDEYPDLSLFPVHKALAATMNSSDAYPLLATVANISSCVYSQSDLRLLFLLIWILFRNKNLNSSMFRPKNSILNQTWNAGQNVSCWWLRSIYICIKLFLFITKTIKPQTMTEARAVGCSFLLEVELGHNAIHMKSDMKPPGCHNVLYITVNSMH